MIRYFQRSHFPFHTIELSLVRCIKSLIEKKAGVFSIPSLVLEWRARGAGSLERLWCFEAVMFCLCLTSKISDVPLLSGTFSIILFVCSEKNALLLLSDIHGEQSWPLVNIIFFSALNKLILLMSCPGFPSPFKPPPRLIKVELIFQRREVD